jgi:hypothetical protein
MKTTAKLLLPILALSASIICASAQEKKEDNNPDRRRGGDRGSFNMDEFRQRMAERLKTSLKVTDDEWAVISPLIEKVQVKMRDSASSRGFGGGAPGGPGGPGAPGGGGDRRRGGGEGGGAPTAGTPGGGGDSQRPVRATSPERDALRTALESETSTPEEIQAKLTALREVRKKSEAELNAAREELRKVLSVRQEAALVGMGMLE